MSNLTSQQCAFLISSSRSICRMVRSKIANQLSILQELQPMFCLNTRIFSCLCAAIILLPLHASAQQTPQLQTGTLPYMNPALPVDQCVEDLIGRMTL